MSPRTGAFAMLVALAATRALAAEPTAEDAEFFEKDVRPLLIARCYKCHGDVLEPKGGLSLTSRAAVLKGGQTGPAAVAGKPQESLLIEAIHYDGLEMPPEGDRLSAVEIARLERWVERGLPWPKSDARALAAGSIVAEDARIAAARASHWSFQPIKNSAPPAVRDASWPRTTIDQFILAELESRGLSPSPPADRRTLLRRLSFDLIGLPPTPEEMAEFLGDTSADAIARRRGSTAGFAPLWRALGPPLARRGPLCRHQGLRPVPGGAISPGPTPIAITSSARSTRICPTTASCSSNWPPTSCRWATTNARWPRWVF